MRGELQQWLNDVGTLQGQAKLEELRRNRAHYRGKVEQLKAEVDKLETSIRQALEWERDYYRRQEQLDLHRRAYLRRFASEDADRLRLSAAADVLRASAVLGNVERWLGDELHAKGGSLSRMQVLRLRQFFSARVTQFHADPSRLCPSLTCAGH
jgi:hypothetical protein